VVFEDVVELQRRSWGEPSRCGPDVKRFEFETRGCFWQDAWCDTWAMITEVASSKTTAVLLGSTEGWSRYQAFIKAEKAGGAQDGRLPRANLNGDARN
jgi:hypothetical protein